MKGNVQDLVRRKLAKKYELRRMALKSVSVNTTLPVGIRYDAMIKLSSLPRNSSKVRIKNRCIVTGRSKGVYSKFGLCRNKFREYALEGVLPGIRKSSW
jgi:small subunit ribosomal protein S14